MTVCRAWVVVVLVGVLVASAAEANIRITEYTYRSVADGLGDRDREFIELTNVGAMPVNMTGWSFDDDKRVPGTFDLSAFGLVMPGESMIITETTIERFRDEWFLDPSTKIIGNLGDPVGNNLGRNDEINIFDGLGGLVDRLTYGDQDFPGSVRTDGASGWVNLAGLGANDPYAWTLSTVEDFQGSWTAISGDVGSPGAHAIPEPAGVFLLLGGGLLMLNGHRPKRCMSATRLAA
ncbi:MAG: lamin tail domain-containing protein [Phycisphaerae bacterium]|nr:lamin tail domain-containing protein [Phycisphaerae bacterium]